jgi:hypothetical protein
VALQAHQEFGALFPAVRVETLEDLDRAQQRRVRGVRSDAGRKRPSTGDRG